MEYYAGGAPSVTAMESVDARHKDNRRCDRVW